MTPLEKAQQRIDEWIQLGDVTEYLDLSNIGLTTLPELPPTLRILYCYSNQLTSLPALPSTLQQLYCNNNSLTSLPSLPQTLHGLYCYNNQLTSLPALPPTLRCLYCYENQLTSLPSLPSTLRYLNCCYNQITSLPVLPPTLQVLYYQSNFLYYQGNPLTAQQQQQIQSQQQQIQQQQIQSQPLPKRIIDSIIRDAITNKETCPILQEPLQENGCILTTCFHIFSKEGFTEWSKKSSECPTCREKCSMFGSGSMSAPV